MNFFDFRLRLSTNNESKRTNEKLNLCQKRKNLVLLCAFAQENVPDFHKWIYGTL